MTPTASNPRSGALSAEGDIYVSFGHEMVNPLILGFPPQSSDENMAEIERRGVLRHRLARLPNVQLARSAHVKRLG